MLILAVTMPDTLLPSKVARRLWSSITVCSRGRTYAQGVFMQRDSSLITAVRWCLQWRFCGCRHAHYGGLPSAQSIRGAVGALGADHAAREVRPSADQILRIREIWPSPPSSPWSTVRHNMAHQPTSGRMRCPFRPRQVYCKRATDDEHSVKAAALEFSTHVQVVTQRLMKLATKGTPVHLPAEVIIRRRKRVRNSSGPSTDTWEMVRARGHLDEVEQLKSSAAPPNSEFDVLPASFANLH